MIWYTICILTTNGGDRMKKKLLNIPDEIWDEVQKVAKDEYRPASTTIIVLIKEALRARKGK